MSRSNSKALKMSQVLDVERKADVLKISHWHDQFSSCELSKNVVLAIHNPIQYRFEKYCPLKLLLAYGKTDGRLRKSFATFWRGCVNCTFSRVSLESGFLVQLGTGHHQKHPFAVCCLRPPWVLKTRLHLALFFILFY